LTVRNMLHYLVDCQEQATLFDWLSGTYYVVWLTVRNMLRYLRHFIKQGRKRNIETSAAVPHVTPSY